MKDRIDAILQAPQARYLQDLLPPRDPLLREMESLAEAEGVPISDPEIGRMLEILAHSIGANRVLEIGTAIGYGTLHLARGAPTARLETIDTDPERIATARGFLTRAGVASRIRFHQGPALEVLKTLSGTFDIVYVDAVKTEYRQYLDLLLPRLRNGGLVVLDNLLWKGWVADPPEEEDAPTTALREFNRYLLEHPDLLALVLPFGDGLGVATKTPRDRPAVS